MAFRFILFACLTAALFVARLPASWMDHVVSELTEGRVRLASSEGSLWQGRAMLAAADPQRHLIAVRPLKWRFGIQAAPLAVSFELHGSERLLASLLLRPAGVQVRSLEIDLPLASLTQAVSHPVARAGWLGRLDIRSAGLFCNWRGHCDGRLIADWLDAALDIVPGRRFGDHRLNIAASGEALQLHLHSLDSEFRIEARGAIDSGGRFALQGTIEGDPEIVDRLPNIMDRNARPSGQPGRTRIQFP